MRSSSASGSVRIVGLFGLCHVLALGCGGDDAAPDAGRDGGVVDDGGGDTCPSGQSYQEPGCGAGPDAVEITAGCYAPCTGAADFSCAALGLACQMANVNPCLCPPGSDGCCGACGAAEWLCLPPPKAPEPYELDSLDALCEGTLSGQQVLDATAPSYSGIFTYLADASETPVTITVAYEMGRIVCHPPVPAPPGTGIPDQPMHLEVEARVTFTTDDGAFAESFVSMLDAWGDASSSFSVRIAEADIMGTYVPMPSDPMLTNVAISLAGELRADGTMGNMFVGGEASSGVGATTPVGHFTAAP